MKAWSRLFLLTTLMVSPFVLSAQENTAKGKSLEQSKKPLTITVDGKEIPIAGHNNVNKLIRMMQKSEDANRPNAGLEDLQSRDTYEWLMLRDPRTNRMPENFREAELNFAQELLFEQGQRNALLAIGDETTWKRRGPYNIGGRTRALAIDRTDTTRILAGGISGGMWLSEDGGLTWRKTTSTTDLQAVSAIAQDLSDNTGQTWYYGTGEIRGNSAGDIGAAFRGDGLFKSTDGGRTWASIASTRSNTPHIFDAGFDYVHNLAVDPTNGDVWAATFGFILRSQDAGISWDTLLTNNTTWTDVAITPTGDVYATLATGGSAVGVFYKDAADADFTDITPTVLINNNMGRTVIDIAPSDENIVYFLSETPNAGTLGATLMKYTKGATEPWEDRSANIPAFGGSVGNYNSQGAYNMVIKAHHSNPDIVFVGGTNLYRSTDGFATDTNTTWIGGYATTNNVSIYPNQHPDQHVLTFYPNSNYALSGNDGGVHQAANILQADEDDTPVDWVSLNNGYYTTQPYAISIDPSAENPDLLMAGFQDNGTWLSTNEAQSTIWTEEFGGDGSFNAMADGGRTRIVSSQNGNTYVFYYSDANDPQSFTGWTRIVPAGAAGFSFVNPFILDPNNENVLYMASTNGVWRNSNYTEIPLFNGGTTSVNWTLIPGTDNAQGTVTTIEASTFEPNVIYFGTSFGEVYRVANANTNSPTVEDVISGKGLPGGAISGISVDPADADKVLMTMSNYNIRSIFYSEDGGQNWSDVSGSLESAADGFGPGPSVRWVEMINSDLGTYYLAGTSTGLYSTQNLITDTSGGDETTWELESADLIGNAVIRHMAVRPYDGRISIATHANGMYEAELPVTQQDRIFTSSLDDVEVVLGSDSLVFDIEGLFTDEGDDNSPIAVSIFENTDEDIVLAKLDADEEKLTLVFNDSIPGSASITLQGSSDGRNAFSSFSVNIEKLSFGPKPIYDQVTNPAGAGITSQVFTDLGGPVWSADDFEVPAGESWSITQVYAPGSKNELDIDEVVVQFWLPGTDTEGAPTLPEIIIFSDTVANSNGPADGNMLLDLRTPMNLDEGTYWVSITPILPFSGNAGRWFWNRTSEGYGKQFHLIDPANLFGAGFTDWVSGDTFNSTLVHLNFSLNGRSSNQAPTDPITGPFANVVSPSETQLAWSKGSFDLAYILYTSTDGVDFKEHVAIKAEANNTYNFPDLEANTEYFYGIRTIDVVGDTTAMTIDSVFTYPLVPTMADAMSITSTGFEIQWDQISADSLIIQVADANGFVDPMVVNDSIKVTSETSYMVSNLDPVTEYQFRMAAFNESGLFAYSEAKNVSTKPSTPTNLEVTDISDEQIDLKWSLLADSEGVNEYRILRGTDAANLVAIDTLTADAEDKTNMFLTFADNNLNANTKYYYGVDAFVSENLSEAIEIDTLTRPSTPMALTATAVTTTSFDANWSAVSTGDYRIDVASDENFSNLVVDNQTVSSAETTLEVNNLMSASEYFFRVSAVNNAGTMGYSNVESVITLPMSPTGFASSSITDNSLTIEWDEAAENLNIDGYKILRGTDANDLEQVGTTETNSFVNEELSSNTTYYFQVIAFNESGDSESLAGNVLTLPSAPNSTAASNITNVSFQANWDVESGDGYRFDLATDQAFTNALITDSVRTTNSIQLNDLSPAKTYFYRVRAYNATGNSEYSAVIETMTSITAPLNLTSSNVEINAATVGWDAVEGVSNYLLDLSTEDDFSSLILDAEAVSDVSFNLTSLSANTEYFARVRAVGEEANSANSEVASFMTLPEIPNAPTNIGVVENNQGNVEISWNLDGSDVIDYVIIERSSENEQNYVQIDSLIGSPEAYTDIFLDIIAKTQFYRVKAGNVSGASDYSEGNGNFILSTDNKLNAAISVYPNPTRDNATLTINDYISGQIRVDIVDSKGQVLKTVNTTKASRKMDIEIALEEMPQGIYMIQISTERGNVVKRILKQ